jgi:hypothetical protein
VQAIKLTQVQLHELFIGPSIIFKSNSFIFFQSIVEGTHETIMMRWIINLNKGIDHLAFEYQTNHIWSQAWDFNTKVKCYVSRGIFGKVVIGVKVQCLKVATKLVVELHTCFPHHVSSLLVV